MEPTLLKAVLSGYVVGLADPNTASRGELRTELNPHSYITEEASQWMDGYFQGLARRKMFYDNPEIDRAQ